MCEDGLRVKPGPQLAGSNAYQEDAAVEEAALEHAPPAADVAEVRGAGTDGRRRVEERKNHAPTATQSRRLSGLFCSERSFGCGLGPGLWNMGGRKERDTARARGGT